MYAAAQVTLQACNIDEARHLYDQLGVLAPILLALSAATPILVHVMCVRTLTPVYVCV
jgi:hypothetical protein